MNDHFAIPTLDSSSGKPSDYLQRNHQEFELEYNPRSLQAETRDNSLALPNTGDHVKVSTFQGILSDWLITQKRMVDILTPRSLDAIESGENFPRSGQADDVPSDADDLIDILGSCPSSLCHLELHELEKNVRYNAVWRIVCSEETQAELALASQLKRVDLMDA